MEDLVRRLGADADRFADKTMFITGAAGFLGYYLTLLGAELSRRGKRVHWICSDILPRPSWVPAEVQWLTFDCREPFPETLRPHFVIHAASLASPVAYRQRPTLTIEANIFGLRNVLDHARRHPVEAMLFFSSSEIYGQPRAIPTAEDAPAYLSSVGPRSCYDEAKRAGEVLCNIYAEQYGLPVKIVRPFNNYGPGLVPSDGRVLADFARSVKEGRDLVLHSNGRPTRTFCYVADAVLGHLLVMLRGRTGVAYNVGSSGPEISVAEVAQAFLEVARDRHGYGGRLIYEQSRDPDFLSDNPDRRCPSIDLARRDLGFEPTIELHDGLDRYLTWVLHEYAS